MIPPSDNAEDWLDEPDDSVAYDFMARVQPGTPEFESLKASLDEADAEIERGEVSEFDVEEILRLGREQLAQHRKKQLGS